MTSTTLIALTYGVIMFICGLYLGIMNQRIKELRVHNIAYDNLAEDEEIVCNNATVIYGEQSGLSWYDNNRKITVIGGDDDG